MAEDSDKPRTSYLPETPDPLLGTTVAGRYLVQRKLGEGGMGGVYLAMHTILEKQVALKVLHGEFARKPDLVERFMQEAKAASRIRHENVIDISDFGSTPEGLVFFAMELLQGHDLHAEIGRARKSGELLPWARTKKIFLQICGALSAAHAKGIVHRDLKPENVYLVEFLGDPDFVKLLDFGIAKLTEVATGEDGGRKLTKTGMLFGTPEYMSPEQARGEPVDPRVDIYAMGCILFQLVTGRVPFEADSFMGVLSLHLTEPPPVIAAEVFDHIGAPRAIAQVIDRALVKDRDARYQTIDELAAAIREASGDAAVAPPQQRPRTPTAPGATEPRGPASLRSREPTGRHKTAWTGQLKVPEILDEPPRAPRPSKAPVVIGLLVALAGAGGAGYFALRDRGGAGAGSGSDVASGSQEGSAAGSGSAIAAAPDAAVGHAIEPKLPERADLVLDSQPRGATVTDLSSGKAIGKTPLHYAVAGSKTPRQFAFHLHGYGDSTIELVPSRETIEYVEKLEKGSSTGVVHQVPDATLKPVAVGAGSATGSAGSADTTSGVVAHPDTGTAAVQTPDTSAARPDAGAPASGSGTKPPDIGGSAARPPDTAGSAAKPDQKCNDEDVPCLKGFGSGS